MTKNIKTSLYDIHVKLGAKIMPFAGFQMPVVYSDGIKVEHQAVRHSVGMFDVSHMGQLWITGEGSFKFMQKITINDIRKLKVGDAQYSAMCYDDGGIIDDLIIYRKNNGYLMVVNASNIEKDLNWLISHKTDDIKIENHSSRYSLIALQGPKSREILSNFIIEELKFYSFIESNILGNPIMLSRTGYTGELGYEIYISNVHAIDLWNTFLDMGVVPCGLASRDILRMEMKYCLYGNDIDESTNPIEAGLGWITAFSKNNFIGQSALLDVKKNQPSRKLVCFILNNRGIPRKGYRVMVNGLDVGYVTSGTISMSLGKGIGMAYIKQGFEKIGDRIDIMIRNKVNSAVIIQSPFVKNTSIFS